MNLSDSTEMPASVRQAYLYWIHGDALLGHANDDERLYVFAKSCYSYLRNKPWSHWLRRHLERDLVSLPRYQNAEARKEMIESATRLFHHLMDFQKTPRRDYYKDKKFSVLKGERNDCE